MHNSVSRKSSLLYIFKPNVSQCLFTLPHSLPSLSLYTFPLHSPSLFAIMLPHSPPPSINLPHPFRLVTLAGILVFAVPFSNLHRTCRRWLQVCCSIVLLFCVAFVLWEMDDYQRGNLAFPKSSIFFICFMGMTQVQILRREEKMIISAS